jgi:hypothetical protein
MLRRVALVRTDVSEEPSAFIISISSQRASVARCGYVPSSPFLGTLMMEAISSYETFLHTRAIRRNIPEDDILHNHRRENLKSYLTLTGWILYWRRSVSPVKYELGFYISEDGILHSHRCKNFKSYMRAIYRNLRISAFGSIRI